MTIQRHPFRTPVVSRGPRAAPAGLRWAAAGGAGGRDDAPASGPRGGGVLFLWRGGWRGPDDTPEPRRPLGSPAADYLGWFAIALLVAALVLPFSLAALVDLVRYLSR